MRSIKSLPGPLRPREKLLKFGFEALTTEELLAVILVTGTKTRGVEEFARKIKKIISQSTDIANTISKEILLNMGLGPSKVAQILAAIELGKRMSNKKTIVVTKTEQVYAYAREIIDQNKESLLCLYINARGEMVKREILAVGSLNRVNLLPREIFNHIKELPIASIILVHNHPSGNLEPSNDDILFTKRVKIAADILGVKLLDHLIVSKEGWKKIKI